MRLKLLPLLALAFLSLSTALPAVVARAPGPGSVVWLGTYSQTDPTTGQSTYYQVAVSLSGKPPNPNFLTGIGVLATCAHPPSPNTPYSCDVDLSTVQLFGATGALTTDPSSGQSVVTWVVSDPGPINLPAGSTFVSVLRAPGPSGDSWTGTFTLTFPSGDYTTGSFLTVLKQPGPQG
jgi:hypothetical protein